MAYLRRLWLREFRNYTHVDLQLDIGTTVFVGSNGQGKSNLLEAVYLVATGRSHRTTHEAEAIKQGKGAARIRALVGRRGRDEELEITLRSEAGKLNTQMRANGVVTPRGSMLGRLPVVLAAPWDLETIRGAGADRRRLLDGALAQLSPAYFFALHRYHRVLGQRNEELRRKVSHGLEPWDAQLVTLGVRLTAQRAVYVKRLRPEAAVWFQRLGGGGEFEMVYRPAWTGASDEERDAMARVQLRRARADEYRRGMTLSGPHRDELDVLLGEQSLRASGSQGQWRTAMLAIRLAERAVMAAELGDQPVLLLDDVLAELDPGRQRRLLEAQGEAQVLATATVVPLLERSVRRFRVEASSITEDVWSPRFGTS